MLFATKSLLHWHSNNYLPMKIIPHFKLNVSYYKWNDIVAGAWLHNGLFAPWLQYQTGRRKLHHQSVLRQRHYVQGAVAETGWRRIRVVVLFQPKWSDYTHGRSTSCTATISTQYRQHSALVATLYSEYPFSACTIVYLLVNSTETKFVIDRSLFSTVLHAIASSAIRHSRFDLVCR